MKMFTPLRNSVMELDEIYFWTASIHEHKNLLRSEVFKGIVLSTLSYLSDSQKIAVYGFVIMPNHVHFIWEMLEMNGKEKPYASFLKHTSHQFQKVLRHHSNKKLYHSFDVKESTRNQRYWNRDPLAIKIDGKQMLEQKLDYCHKNPLQEHWNLASSPEDYFYSSAYDYAQDMKSLRFNFLKHYFDRV
jgi:putative transposase